MSSPDAETPEQISGALKAITGSLRSTIDAHGPITKEFAPSAAKRIAKQLHASGLLATVASQAHTLSTVEQELAALKAEYALAISWGWRPDVAQLAYRRLEAKLEARAHTLLPLVACDDTLPHEHSVTGLLTLAFNAGRRSQSPMPDRDSVEGRSMEHARRLLEAQVGTKGGDVRHATETTRTRTEVSDRVGEGVVGERAAAPSTNPLVEQAHTLSQQEGVRLPTVEGHAMVESIEGFERRCLVQIARLQESPYPDHDAIEIIAQAVRCAREFSSYRALKHREATAALEAHPHPRSERGWQPIETAPKDGTQVWLWWDGRRRLAHWHEVENPPSIGGRFANWLTDDKGSISATVKPTLWARTPPDPQARVTEEENKK